jgi:hypothetical protein
MLKKINGETRQSSLKSMFVKKNHSAMALWLFINIGDITISLPLLSC